MKQTKTRASVSDRMPANLRAKPPSGGGEFDPYFRGPNVLIDPNFEAYRDMSGGWLSSEREGGSYMYTLPFIDLNCPQYLRWPDGTCTDDLIIGWAQSSGPYGTQLNDWNSDPQWHLGNFMPLTGQYHAMWFMWESFGSIVPGELTAYSPYTPPFTARVEPGDAVSWNASCMATSSVGTPKVIMITKFYNSARNLISVVQSASTSLTTSYVNYSVSTSAPSGSYYIRSTVAFNGTGQTLTAGLVDKARLGIT